jgi:phosphoglycerate dehydrogenase-like enzyme
MKVLVTPRSFGKTDPMAWQILADAGLEVVRNTTGGILPADQLKEMLADCEGVIIGVDPLTRDVLAAAPKLKAIAKYGVGVDNIDLVYCEEKGLPVSRTVGANSDAVADYAFALMLALARQVIKTDHNCRQGEWKSTTSLDVNHRTIGILGLGAIGKGVARRARGFAMNILGYDVYWDETFARETGVERTSLEQIFQTADFISIHLPLLPETQNLIGAPQIEMMKPNAILVNTARGGIVDENALLAALISKRIYGAGIDAFASEPPTDPAWYSLDNVIISPHAAAATLGATEQMGRMAARNLVAALTAGLD